MKYLKRDEFNSNLNEIFIKSNELNDGWRLIETTGQIKYLEKKEQFMLNNEIVTFVYHIVYSESYEVPVFYLNAFKSNGAQLDYSSLNKHFKLDSSNADLMVLSQQEHPILFKPFYFLHPCKTSEWMSQLINANNYTLKWFSFVAFTLNISFDYLKYVNQ